MQKLMMVALCLGSLTACVTQYGNYAKISDADNIQMADDSAHKLTALYPPASTHFALLQTAQDAYGIELVRKLRENGYAIVEGNGFDALFGSPAKAPEEANNKEISTYVSPVKVSDLPASASSANAEASAGATGSDKPLGYIVDEIEEGLYRVMVSIDSKALSRVYAVSGKGLVPAGSWTHKEE